MTTQSSRGRRLQAAAAAVAVSVVTLAPPSAGSGMAESVTSRSGVYLVALRAAPLASYDGHLPGLKATTPRSGERLRSRAPAALAYMRHLTVGRSRVLAALGQPEVLYTYSAALNGFAARLSGDQAALAASLPGVVSVTSSQKARLDSVNPRQAPIPPHAAPRAATPAAPAAGPGGRGTVIGVIDSGVWPENPSFAGVPLRRVDVRRTYPGFGGSCGSGEDWSDDLCNAKVIAARHFVKGFGADSLSAADFLSPRDGSGHGSHTAATAAGNAGIDVTIDGQDFGRIAGAAPEAALSVYKACWTAPDPRDDGCTTADTVAAIDAAVRDGVDVISYSIGAGDAATSVIDQAFRNAARAGIFIAASAGDEGPRPSTVAGHGPWVTTVAATSGHQFEGTVVLGNGDRYVGSMASTRSVRRAPLVSGVDARNAGSSQVEARRCYPGALDARLVDGAVVVCERGGTPRVSKSVTVDDAGGAAMLLVNTAPGSTDADVHAVPAVHLEADAAMKVRSYLATASRPTAAVRPSGDASPAPVTVADFSSRGPDLARSGNLLKPDIAAPGVAVVSAVAPPSNAGRLWGLASGTSMAAPQVAGFAAVVMSAHRDWSASAVKSALVTAASPLDTSDGPLAVGAGLADLRGALDPGLVYDQNGRAWSNQPSVAVGNLVARTTTTRRLTNVSSRTETYAASLSGLPGLSTTVDPAVMTLAPGQSRSFSITLAARRTARYDRFVGGALTWSGSHGHQVTSPIAVRPHYVKAPQEVRGSASRGSLTLRSRAGVTGTLSTTLVGPVPARPRALSLQQGRFDPLVGAAGSASWTRRYAVPEGTAAVRFEVTSPQGHDVNLYVDRDGETIVSAESPAAREVITLPTPDPGDYDVHVHAPAPRAPAGPARPQPAISARFTGWVLPAAARSSAASAPRQVDVTGGRVFAVPVRWSSLDPSRRWFGQLRYQDSATSVSSFTVN